MSIAAINALYGFGISTGLVLTGMNRPVQTWSFFNLRKWKEGNMDLTLGIIFPVALISHYIIWKLSQKREKPLLEKSFNLPTNKNIDSDLIIGASTFGLGWAIGGYCPGPAVVAAFSGQIEPIIGALSMFIGWSVAHIFKLKRREPKKSITSIISHSISFSRFAALIATFATIHLLSNNQIIERKDHRWSFSYIPIIGGLFLGTSIGAAMYITGQIIGLSGMLSGVIFKSNQDNKLKNIGLITGIALGSFLFRYIDPSLNLTFFNDIPLWRFCLGGFLTGVGTGLANGCTSGHGICGMSRLSPRSILATGLFMLTSVVTATIFNF